MACEYLRSMQATKAFLSASGVSAKLGVTSKNMFEVEIKQTIMQSSDRRVLVADSSKFDHVFAAHFAELSDFETLVTDHLFSDPQAEQLNQVDVELIRA
jgi:DeoR family deoxyribose operon repressor